jgi:hypothetical protein
MQDGASIRSDETNNYVTGLAQLSAVERSHILRSVRMNPVLQYMVGPLLKYDTVDDNGVWHGACLIVSAYFLVACSMLHTISDPSHEYSR